MHIGFIGSIITSDQIGIGLVVLVQVQIGLHAHDNIG